MSKSTPVAVSAAFIRTAFLAGEFTAPDEALASLEGKDGSGRVRGRISPAAVQAFEAQVKGKVYAGEKVSVPSRTVTLPLTKPSSTGARLKRPETFSLAEVRTLAGQSTDTRGRVSAATIAKATEAVQAQRGW